MSSSVDRRLHEARPASGRRSPDPDWLELVLDYGFGHWIGAFVLLELIDACSYNWVIRAAGLQQVAPDWHRFSSWMVEAGGAEWVSGGLRTIQLTDDWAANSRALLIEEPGQSETTRSRMVDAWLKVPDDRFLHVVAGWALELHRWDLLDQIWREHLNGQNAGRHPEAAMIYRCVPEDARRQYPALTWAMAAAEGHSNKESLRVAIRTMIRDGVLLHSSWHLNEDLDTAVVAGSIWMLCQRLLPAGAPTRPLDASALTGSALERTIAEHARTGTQLSKSARTVFAVVSAHTALGQGDLKMAASKASLAGLLGGEGTEVDLVATGIVQLSLALGGVPPLDDEATRTDAHPEGLKDPGLIGRAGLVMLLLAKGLRALDRLDRAECERVLQLVAAEEAWASSVGTVHAYLEAVYQAVWISPERALANLDAAIAMNAGRSAEELEPLGLRLIGRARVFILNRLGAVDAARNAVGELLEGYREVAQARTHLYAGEAGEAARVATAGILDSRTWLKDRAHLAVLKNASVLLDPIASPGEQVKAARRILVTVAREHIPLAIAHLPRKLRQAVLEKARSSSADIDRRGVEELEARLVEVVDGCETDRASIRLTGREQVLLPLLARPDPVPDIAKSLHVSPNTIRKQVVSLRAKFQAGNRAELIRKARQWGHLS